MQLYLVAGAPQCPHVSVCALDVRRCDPAIPGKYVNVARSRATLAVALWTGTSLFSVQVGRII